MKVIHDIKSPMLSIKQIINSIEVENGEVSKKDSTNFLRNLDKKVTALESDDLLKLNEKLTNDLKVALETLNDSQRQINFEIEDMEEMIENLKTEFKSKNQMKFKEEVKEVEAKEFLQSLQNSHMKLADIANNKLTLKIYEKFPIKILVAKSLLKRILNNFISNALKHTKEGEVNVGFSIID